MAQFDHESLLRLLLNVDREVVEGVLADPKLRDAVDFPPDKIELKLVEILEELRGFDLADLAGWMATALIFIPHPVALALAGVFKLLELFLTSQEMSVLTESEIRALFDPSIFERTVEAKKLEIDDYLGSIYDAAGSIEGQWGGTYSIIQSNDPNDPHYVQIERTDGVIRANVNAIYNLVLFIRAALEPPAASPVTTI